MNEPLTQRRALARLLPGLVVAAALLCSGMAAAHGVAEDDGAFIETAQGVQLLPYLYLGAKVRLLWMDASIHSTTQMYPRAALHSMEARKT